MNKTKVYWGPPGCGKTTTLIKEIEAFLESGYGLEDICFCTYRKSMSQVIIDRISSKFDLSKEEKKEKLRYFATIHGVSKRIGDYSGKVIEDKDISDFCVLNGYSYESSDYGDSSTIQTFLNTKSWLVALNRPWEYCIHYPKFIESGMSRQMFLNIMNKWDCWKIDNNFIDFDDMLLNCLRDKTSPPTPILIVDEFQDINPMQYKIYKFWKEDKEHVIIAGDPLQSIYSFQGGSPSFFMSESNNPIVLDKTYRLTKSNWNFARKIVGRSMDVPNITCINKGTNPIFVNNIISNIDTSVDTYILARANYICDAIRVELDDFGLPYSGKHGWTGREKKIYNCILKIKNNISPLFKDELIYFLKCLKSKYLIVKKSGKNSLERKVSDETPLSELHTYVSPIFVNEIIKEPLHEDFILASILSKRQKKKIKNSLRKYSKIIDNELKIRVSTIHSVKGDEATDVFLIGNITKRILKNIYESEETEAEENRVFFVGATRARRNLYILEDYLESGITFNFPYINNY